MKSIKDFFIDKIAKKQAEKAVDSLISGLPSLSKEQQQDFEEMLEKDKNVPHTEIIRETLNIGDTVSEYNFDNIQIINENNLKRYLLESKNRDVAYKSVTFLLDLLKEVLDENNISLGFEIDNSLNFSCENYKGRADFSFLEYLPFTKTGKNSKYPIELIIANKFNDFGVLEDRLINGEIYYLKNGQIGKSRIFVWNNNSCYTFNFAVKNNNLEVTKIEKTTNIEEYKKETLYQKKT